MHQNAFFFHFLNNLYFNSTDRSSEFTVHGMNNGNMLIRWKWECVCACVCVYFVPRKSKKNVFVCDYKLDVVKESIHYN